MSLPTRAQFIKDGAVVGTGSCNIGWYFHSEGVHGCIREAAIDAVRFFEHKATMSTEEFKAKWGFAERFFGTHEQLRSADFVIVYHYKVLGRYLNQIWNNELDAKGLAELIDSGVIPEITPEERAQIQEVTNSIRMAANE